LRIAKLYHHIEAPVALIDSTSFASGHGGRQGVVHVLRGQSNPCQRITIKTDVK
jgi:hypothetical protein